MTDKEFVLDIHRNMGKADALGLATRATSMTATEIIEEESKVPMFVWGTDYSKLPKDSPIAEVVNGEIQIFTMITPVNTAHYPNITPSTERSLYSLCHTKNPKKAKAWVAPLGTSGLYSKDECCVDIGHVWKSIADNNAYAPNAYPANWIDLGTLEEVQGNASGATS